MSTIGSRPAEPGTTAPPSLRQDRRVPRVFYLMVLPALALFAVFHTVPLLTGMFFSLTNYAGYGEWSFVGLRNYVNLFGDDRIYGAYGFTFLFAIVSTVAVNIIALAVAIALNGRIRFKTGFRGIFFIPNILSILIVGYVFNYLFSNSVPAIAEALGITSLTTSILASPDTAWIGVVILSVWQAAAFNIIIYLAGLQTIPGELYEAASLDGASPWKQFTSITFPMIGAFFTINMVLSLKNFLQVFDQIISLTAGGPGTSTESISLLIYRGGFQGGEYGYQTANAVIYLFVIIAISFIQLRILQRREASF
ncbi:sugar ABC transporter permease [Arthrobacter sp. NamB2]|uniref:carbohydrate ABC transporter permease n=1 Tax=Arthrobacter sp. NamB2 TaxID=2576035 RepID=UPI0010C977EF|nr:sugar ABC transporter permease [Arthrobacter sp. NamB2]TKV28491.1 sugar ABC transporter permease [Arthrobacter sp. NamB2]